MNNYLSDKMLENYEGGILMRVSREMASKVFYALIKKRDNTKGNLTEIEWYSFLHTINVINEAIAEDITLVNGHPLSKFELMTDLQDLILPREVKHEISSADFNLVDYSIIEGETEISDYEYSLSVTPLEELMAKAKLKAVKEANKKEKKNQDEEIDLDEIALSMISDLEKGYVDVLNPDDFKLVQDALCNQVSKKNAAFTTIDKLTTNEKVRVLYSSVKDRAVFGADSFNENAKQGFRPIGMSKAMFPHKNFRFANFDTNEQFYTWFNNKIFG